jgi:hypothetical protein
MSFVCEFCKKEYSSLSSLNYHKKTASFCLKLQDDINMELLKCEFCNKEFSSKTKLNSHLNNCKEKDAIGIKKEAEYIYKSKLEFVEKEIEKTKKEYESKLDFFEKEIEKTKKEYESKLELIKKEYEYKEEILKKESIIKDEMIQTLKDQIKLVSEKIINNNTSYSTTNNIVNTINIKNEEYIKLFDSIKPMIPDNINKSMRNIRYDQMVGVIEELDEYFINQFVKNFKEYIFVTDESRGKIIIKLENGESSKVNAVQFILDCFKIGEKELRQLFTAVSHYLNSQHDMEEITTEEFVTNKEKLKQLCYFVFNNKSNSFVNKLASSLVKNSIKLSNKRLTDNKVVENEIIKLME